MGTGQNCIKGHFWTKTIFHEGTKLQKDNFTMCKFCTREKKEKENIN